MEIRCVVLEWVIMSGIESYLPPEHQFNEAVHEFREVIVDELYEDAEALDIINVEQEFSRHFQGVWQLSDVVARVLASETEPHEVVQGAMYRGMTFALQVSDAISSGKVTLSLNHWVDLAKTRNATHLGEAIYIDIQEYLSQRPDIDSLIGLFMSEISAEDYMLYHHHIETAAGMIFMLAERSQAEQYVQGRAQSLSPDDFMSHGRTDREIDE